MIGSYIANMVIIELSDADAQSFALWRKYQGNFEVLLSSGAFDIKNGSAEVHFDHLGRIATVKRHEITYKLFT